MIGYRPHPSLLSGNGGGSGGSGVDQTARDAVAAADAVNATQATEIGALKAADTAFETRVAAGETKDGTQDTAISGLQTADTALAGRATALEGRATSGETKDTSQDADLVSHAARLKTGEDKDVVQDADLVALHGADTTLAGRASALEGRATAGEAKDVTQDADLVAHGSRLTSAESKNTAQDTEIAGLHSADTALGTRATNLESRATSGESKDSAQDSSLASHGTRLDTAEQNIRNIATATGTVVLGKKRFRVGKSGPGYALDDYAPAGTTEIVIVAGGGGASGVALRTSSSTPRANGGHCGQVRDSGVLPFVRGTGMTLDVVIGLGGPSATVNSNDVEGQNEGTGSTARLRKSDGTLVWTVFGRGGQTYGALQSTGTIESGNAAVAQTTALLDHPDSALPGHAHAGVTAKASAQNTVDGPTSGGGAVFTAGSSYGGSGGTIQHRYRPEFNRVNFVPGGKGAGVDASGAQSAAEPGKNDYPDEAGSYGTGGGGGYFQQGQGTFSLPGAGGAFPCAGGGGAYGIVANSATNMPVTSGAGADGFVDVFFRGKPQVS